jgi:hypothetical protein
MLGLGIALTFENAFPTAWPKMSVSLHVKNQSLLNSNSLELSASRNWDIENHGPETGRRCGAISSARKAPFMLLRNPGALNPRKRGTNFCSSDISCRAGTDWLGRKGSNLRMLESKSSALPLGDAPAGSGAKFGLGPDADPYKASRAGPQTG